MVSRYIQDFFLNTIFSVQKTEPQKGIKTKLPNRAALGYDFKINRLLKMIK